MIIKSFLKLREIFLLFFFFFFRFPISNILSERFLKIKCNLTSFIKNVCKKILASRELIISRKSKILWHHGIFIEVFFYKYCCAIAKHGTWGWPAKTSALNQAYVTFHTRRQSPVSSGASRRRSPRLIIISLCVAHEDRRYWRTHARLKNARLLQKSRFYPNLISVIFTSHIILLNSLDSWSY